MPKTDLYDVNLPQLYEAHRKIDQLIVNAEGIDKMTKEVWQFSSLWNLHKHVIPTRDNMSLSQAGQPIFSDWRHSDFLYTAESIEREFGFPEGLLSHQRHYCTYREGEYEVFLDIYGNVVDIDDPELDAIFRQARNFPEKLHKEFCRLVQTTFGQVFSNVLDLDPDEPFGALIAYQHLVPIRITKEAKQGFTAIEKELNKLAAKPLRSRQDANTLREGAEVFLSLREIATSGRKFSWDRMFQEAVLAHLADHLANSSSPSMYRLTKAVNQLQDALGSGRQISRKGFFGRLTDAFPPLELSIDPPQVAMVAMQTTTPRPQGERKENANPQQAHAHTTKTDPDVVKFMKDVKSELGALRTLMLKMEALLTTRKRKPDDRSGKQGKAHAAFAQGKNRKVQKGNAASAATQNMPALYMSSSESEHDQEEVHFANYAQACDPFPTFARVDSIVGPFARTVVQSARPEQSRADYLGLSAPRLSNKKRTQISEQLLRPMIEMEDDRDPTIPSQPFRRDFWYA